MARQDALLQRLGLPLTAPQGPEFAPGPLLEIMARDKKTVGGRLRFVLPDRIGRVELVQDVDPAAVTQALLGP